MSQRNSTRLTNRATSRASNRSSSRPQTGSSAVGSISPSVFSSRLSSRAHTPLPIVHGPRHTCGSNADDDETSIPVSIDFEYRAVIVGTAHVVIDIRNFRALYKLQPTTAVISALPGVVDEIIGELHIDRIAAQHRKDLHRILTDKRHDYVVKKYKVKVALIVSAVKQAKYFEGLTKTLTGRLRHSFQQHTRRYFLSYATEPDANNIPEVLDYQDYILKSTDAIAAKIAAIEDDLVEYKSLQETFLSNYLENLQVALGIIEKVCGATLNICATLKQWVYRDKDYAKKLWDYIISTNMRRGKILEEIRRCNRKKSELTLQIGRSEDSHRQANKRLEERRQEGQRVLTSREALTLKLSQTQEELQKRSAEVKDTNKQLLNRTSNSPKYLEALNRKLQQLEEEVAALGVRQTALQRQIGKLTTSSQNLETGSESAECENSGSSLASLQGQLQEVKDSVGTLEVEAGHLEERVGVARHIRGLKVSSAQLRKLYLQYTGSP